MALNVSILETLIQNQQDAIRRHTLHSCIIVSLGVAIILITNFFNAIEADGAVKSLMSIGGGLISTLSAFPINQIITRKEKANTYRMFRQNLEGMSSEDARKLEEMLWDSVKKL